MQTSSSVKTFTYEINPANEIVWVSENWLDFATDNSGSHLRPEALIGTSLWNHITNPETQHIYTIMVDKVRRTNQPIKIPFRCDSPELRRYMHMHIHPLPGQHVQFESRIIKEERRDRMPLLDTSLPRSDDFLVMCGWCKKVQTGQNGWLEVEYAIWALGLIEFQRLPGISHGICPTCSASLMQ